MKIWQHRLGWFFVALLAVSLALAAQQGQQQQTPPPKAPGQTGQQPAQAVPPAEGAPVVNPEEEKAYVDFFNAPRDNVRRQAQLGEEFLVKYPDSRYRESVYGRLANVYLSLNEEEKMFVAGEKALELNPDNVDVLALMGWAVPRRVQLGSLDAQEKLTKSEQYARHAMTLLAELPKPDNLTEEDFQKAKNEKLSMCHSGLGVIRLHRQQYAEMATEMEKATTLSSSPDPIDFYLLGEAYRRTKRPHEAVAAFDRCAELPSALQENCKALRDETKKEAAGVPKPPSP